jgi:predicted nuclease of predicted toxin-antitoxin system
MAESLRRAGYDAHDVRDVGLRGQTDLQIFEYAQAHQYVLISGDLGFSNILSFPLGAHAGIVVMRVPNEIAVTSVISLLIRSLDTLRDDEISGLLIIIEPGKIRIRRPRAH